MRRTEIKGFGCKVEPVTVPVRAILDGYTKVNAPDDIRRLIPISKWRRMKQRTVLTTNRMVK